MCTHTETAAKSYTNVVSPITLCCCNPLCSLVFKATEPQAFPSAVWQYRNPRDYQKFFWASTILCFSKPKEYLSHDWLSPGLSVCSLLTSTTGACLTKDTAEAQRPKVKSPQHVPHISRGQKAFPHSNSRETWKMANLIRQREHTKFCSVRSWKHWVNLANIVVKVNWYLADGFVQSDTDYSLIVIPEQNPGCLIVSNKWLYITTTHTTVFLWGFPTNRSPRLYKKIMKCSKEKEKKKRLGTPALDYGQVSQIELHSRKMALMYPQAFWGLI